MPRKIGNDTRARRAGGAYTYHMPAPIARSDLILPKRTKYVYASNTSTRKRNSRGVKISRLTRNPLNHTGKCKPILDTGDLNALCNRDTGSNVVELKPVVKPRSFLNWLFVDSDEENEENEEKIDVVEMDFV